MNLNQQITDVMFKINRQLKHAMSRNTKLSNLTLIQLETLVFIKNNPDVQMNMISEYFSITNPSATSLLNKLASLGFVTRESDKEDRRVVRISLTKRGTMILEEGLKRKNEHISAILRHIPDEEKKNMLLIMTNLTKRLETMSYEK